MLPGGLKWKRDGFKYLQVYLGSEKYKEINLEGMVEKVCTKLSKWTWILPLLCYRGRVLVTNSLIASTLWHKFTDLDPTTFLVKELQKKSAGLFLDGGGALGESPCTVSTRAGRGAGFDRYPLKDKELPDTGSTLLPVPGGTALEDLLYRVEKTDTINICSC